MDNFDDFNFDDMSDNSGSGGFDSLDSSSSNDESSFDFDLGSNNNSNESNSDDGGTTSKKAIILVIVGVVLLVAVVFIMLKLNNKGSNDTQQLEVVNNQQVEQTTTQNTNVAPADNRTADEIMSTNAPNVVVTEKIVSNGIEWQEVTGNENVEFSESYMPCTFTITSIKHYARAVDINNNLVIKTTITGSISGLSGTYDMDIPYTKGCKLNIGDSFNINVQLGQYNGKSVVGEIAY